ncbi:Hypothetical protein CINCED_3A021144 [Cinara cedri]|uniref:Uncharacterized protein n=1 Tax=Cinara cedri TaxID=506608 RepID=A0A5E4MZ42_9HEMI|nr:Hypothetical protein CINCED_3A021144 [Cinara cedri]
MRNIEIEANVMEITPEFEIEMNNFKLQTRQLDKSLHNQYGLIKKFQDDFRNNELNVLRELDKSTTKIFNFMNIFETYIQYNTIMAKNNEIKQKNASLECELFQKQYELEKKKEKKVKAEKEENQLKAQLDTLKQSIRQQAAYNKVLGHKYNNELNKKNQIHKPI